ncbi:MAG: DUF3325 domain-containing protein [Acinetobacter sp.]|nr:DUF3325 domain-containing protein [Acinetobacter sp.]MBP8206187.1 DUF3325 domain-containing protein [Acinetobacter sp.]
MMFFLFIWAMSSLGFFALASSMAKHQKQIFGHELDVQKTKFTTIMGWILLIIALFICIVSGSVSNMMSYWLGALTFAALFTGLCLSYLETKMKTIAIITAVIATLSGLIHLF